MGLKDIFGGGAQPLQAAADQVSPGTLERPRALYGNQDTAGFGRYAGCQANSIPGVQVRSPLTNEYGSPEAYGYRPDRRAEPAPRRTSEHSRHLRHDHPHHRDGAHPHAVSERFDERRSAREFVAPVPPTRGSSSRGHPRDPRPFYDEDRDEEDEDIFCLTELDLNKDDAHNPAQSPQPQPRTRHHPSMDDRSGGMTSAAGRAARPPWAGGEPPARTGSLHNQLKMDAGTALRFFGNIVRDFLQAPPVQSPATSVRPKSLPAPPGGAQRARRHSSFDLRLLPEPDPRDFERVTVRIEMLEEQEMIYRSMLNEARLYIQRAGPAATNVHKILMNLRLACNSVDLLPPALRRHVEENLGTGRMGMSLLRLLQDTSEENSADSVCPVCLDGMPEVRTECGHIFHRECLEDWFAQRTRTCPMCRVPIGSKGVQVHDRLHDAVIHAEDLTKSTMIHLEAGAISQVSSNKLAKVTECICIEIQSYRDIADPQKESPKFVLVSSFRPILIDMSNILQSCGIKYHWCFPSMAKSVIRDELVTFSLSEQPAVLLLHARAVSTKMDFSAATFMYFMDPWTEGKLQSIAEGCICKNRRGRKCLIANFVSMGSVEEEVIMGAPHMMAADPAQVASRIINPLL